MSATVDSLILDLVEWVAKEARPYDEVMDAWRTSCPRLTVWEDAVDGGFVAREFGPDGVLLVTATPAGRRLLEARGRGRSAGPAARAQARP